MQSIFLQNPHKWHPIAHPLVQDKGCLLWVHILDLYFPSVTAVIWCMQYHVILDDVIVAPTVLQFLNTFWLSDIWNSFSETALS